MSSKLAVVAIVVGHVESGYCFSSKHDYEKDTTVIHTHNWHRRFQQATSMAPTCVLFSKEKVFDSFGYEAEEKYLDLSEEGEHEDWYFFKHFVTSFYKQEQPLSKSTKLKSTDGKEMMALDVFSAIIKVLKDKFLDKCKFVICEKDIQWVLPVPAVWYDDVKYFMKKAAKNAGINDDELLVITEEEAGIVYCKHLPIERLHTAGGVYDTSTFTVGSKHIVLNCKDEAMFLAEYKINEDFSLNELYNACYETCGGNQIFEAFKRLLTDIVGAPTMIEFFQNHTKYDMDMYKDFVFKWRTFPVTSKKMITMKYPLILADTFEEKTGKTMSEAIQSSTFSSKVRLCGDRIRFDADLLKGLFEDHCAQIIAHVNDLLQIPAIKGTKTIVMIGEFSEIPFLQYKIKEAFPEMRVIIPYDSTLASARGAVLYGHEQKDTPKYVTCRVAKFIEFFRKGPADRV